ncbi:MAG: ribosome-associated translation inhibitor RaiA [Pseudomonadota bacterium]
MQIQIIGKNMDLGDALRQRIAEGLEGAVKKYFDRPSEGHVVVAKDAHLIGVDCNIHLPSGITLQAHGEATEPYAALEAALDKIEKRVRRYKRRLKDHHQADRAPMPTEPASAFVIQGPSDEEEEEPRANGDASPLVIAEMSAEIKTMTVSEAVMQLELGDSPALMFRSVAHGGLNMIYRRPDGHIGWLNPANETT